MKRTIAAVVLASLGVGGCASLGSRPAEEVVAERAQLRLDLLMNGGWKDAYLLSSPSYRATETESQYSIRYGGAGMWLGATVEKVVCHGDPASRCEVNTIVKYQPPGSGFVMPRLLPETWIFTEDNWYKYEE